jgi:hypothetical protein
MRVLILSMRPVAFSGNDPGAIKELKKFHTCEIKRVGVIPSYPGTGFFGVSPKSADKPDAWTQSGMQQKKRSKTMPAARFISSYYLNGKRILQHLLCRDYASAVYLIS